MTREPAEIIERQLGMIEEITEESDKDLLTIKCLTCRDGFWRIAKSENMNMAEIGVAIEFLRDTFHGQMRAQMNEADPENAY